MSSAPQLACIVLAAGRSTRFGSPKALAALGGRTLLARTLAATEPWPTVVVAAPAIAAYVAAGPQRRLLVNVEPWRGMVHSFRLADAAIDPAATVAIVPVDLPLLDERHVQALFAAATAEVTFPVDGEREGHPVILRPGARAVARRLPDGDGLRAIKTWPGLTVARIASLAAAHYLDVDRPADLARQASGLPPGIVCDP